MVDYSPDFWPPHDKPQWLLCGTFIAEQMMQAGWGDVPAHQRAYLHGAMLAPAWRGYLAALALQDARVAMKFGAPPHLAWRWPTI